MIEESALSTLGKPGRPTKFTPETTKRLLTALADGLTQKQACLACGIGETTLHDWRKEHPELEAKLAKAREQCRQKSLAAIQAAGDRDWRAHEAFLRLSFFRDYRAGANTTVEVSAQAGTVVVSDEQRQRLIELLNQALAETADEKPIAWKPELSKEETEWRREGFEPLTDTTQPVRRELPDPNRPLTDVERVLDYSNTPRGEDNFVDPYRVD